MPGLAEVLKNKLTSFSVLHLFWQDLSVLTSRELIRRWTNTEKAVSHYRCARTGGSLHQSILYPKAVGCHFLGGDVAHDVVVLQ